MRTPDLSIVLLCYGAGAYTRTAVREIVASVEPRIPNFELILVANYSSVDDETPSIARAIASSDARFHCTSMKKEGAYGWDVRSGFTLATGRTIAYIDGDGQVPFGDIVRVYDALIQEKADVAKTYRTERGDDRWRIFISFAFNILFHLLFPGSRVRDVNAKPKLFTREALQRINPKSNDWFIDSEILLTAYRLKVNVVQIPTTFNKLEGRRSFVKPGTILEFLRNLLVFRMRSLLRL